jgi:hypothetical protein
MTTAHSGVDIDDRLNCPGQDRCEACGSTSYLEVCTVGSQVGVYCATFCATCINTGRTSASASVSQVIERVLEHCEHLGITVDEMAAALDRERRGGDRR